MTSIHLALLAAALVTPVDPDTSSASASASAPISALPSAVAERAAGPSVIAPPAPRETTRVAVKMRPFLGLTRNSWGGIGDARIEHYFRLPFMLGLELSPFAVAADGQGPGALAQLRVHGAYVNDYFSVGMGVGGQWQRFGRSGLSLAPMVRLGSLDGLNFTLSYSYSVAPNKYSGKSTVGFSNLQGALAVPLSRRLALELDGGLNLQSWIYTSVGLRHRLRGDGGPGTWYLSGSFGLAWVTDVPTCDFDAAIPCGASARSFGPTVGFGVEYRF